MSVQNKLDVNCSDGKCLFPAHGSSLSEIRTALYLARISCLSLSVRKGDGLCANQYTRRDRTGARNDAVHANVHANVSDD